MLGARPGRSARPLTAARGFLHRACRVPCGPGAATGPDPWVGPPAAINVMLLEEDMTMRTYDLTPLFRSTIGFDRLNGLLDAAFGEDGSNGYPPYNIEKVGEDAYRITMAVAGFAEKDLSIVAQESVLVIAGRLQGESNGNGEGGRFLHRGIAARAFERKFSLADHIKVTGASLVNGLLHVELVREVPEAMKPRQIKIATKSAKEPQTIEAKTAA